jgi:cytochrome c biogenesis protein CcmG/thiol:disulfide interchange protein DsbE
MIVALWISVAVLAVMVVGLALVVRGTLQVIEGLKLLDRPRRAVPSVDGDGLPVGEVAPVLRGRTLDGGQFDASSLAGSEYVVVIANSACRSCDQFLGEIEAAPADHSLPPTIVITDPKRDGDPSAVPHANGRLTVIPDVGRALSAPFGTHRTPHVFVVGADGRVAAQGVTGSLDGFRDLVAAAAQVGPSGVSADA